ncbi:selenocysteine-specific translation elongation factor [Serinicoccus kebangsaanensis]|uniref:selenocysteine-specific translation elongation factor n=1 Tax=Serinicoccus kebangsaanensis TaxID=2602069 RepID=UPI00124C17AD|nr:selenocysteine-specific translation elongation factor [Serinicoccus kebangsaanensis]
MTVIATAGHVDHGKSALVHALTGMEPDRWEAERRRGLTIDLGYAWTTLPDGRTVAFVDVPGHRRFIGNMLSGIGPAAAVLLVVSADDGWSAQSTEHLRAVHALRLRHGVLAVTRADLADPGPTLAQAREQLSGTSLEGIPAVAVSARTGHGLDRLRELLGACCSALPTPAADAPVRLWIDRAFTVHGAGTVVTGTLPAGAVEVGMPLLLTSAGDAGPREVVVRGIHSLGRPEQRVEGAARVAVNLRGVDPDQVGRGQALLAPDHPWWLTGSSDVLLDADALPAEVTAHVGTAARPARLRTLEGRWARLRTDRPVPLGVGDRLILRDPGREGAVVGARVLDPVAPPLRRNGAARRRAAALQASDDRHGVAVAGRTVSRATAEAWVEELSALVRRRAQTDPLDPRLPLAPALRDLGRRTGLPDRRTLEAVVAMAGLEVRDERVGPARAAGSVPEPGEPPALRALLDRLARDPLDAPTRPELDAMGIGGREIAAASGRGALLRLPGDVLLGPEAADRAVDALTDLAQPFTTSQARATLGVSRKVAIALLEHLDARGHTRHGPDGTRSLTT